MQEASIFLRAEKVNKQVKSGDRTITILHDANLTIKTGESVAILGASGSGKTTLLTLLAGLDTPTTGEIYFQQEHLNNLNEEERARIRGQYIGFIFQSFQLIPTLTALENVMLPLEIQYMPHTYCKKEASIGLQKVGLDERMHHYPRELSGGEQQRVAIARAFVNQPKIIFADEMTGNLDTNTGNLVSELLFKMNQEEQTTLVLVTHDPQFAARCQKQLLLQNGVLQPC